MKRCNVLLVPGVLWVLLCCGGKVQAQSASAAAPQKSALLIGINTYDHPPAEVKTPDGAPRTGRYGPALVYPNLKGPLNDVESMRQVLTSEKFGFPSDEKHIHVLLEKDATHDGILRAMQQYLVTDPQPGDTVVLYISSHGSVRVDPQGHGQTYDLDGSGRNPSYLENTIVPYDWYLGADDIFSRDLRHMLNQAADRNIHLTAIFDSCHSGSLARGLQSSALVARDFEFDPRPMPADPFPAETAGTPPESRKDNPVLVLSAAQKDQSAVDVQNSMPPHGLFTSALVETLEALPAGRSVDEVFRRLQIAMELMPGTTNQQPELDTSPTRRKQPLFGGEAGSGPATAAIISSDRSGIVLDVGTLADIGVGSEFTEVNETNGVRVVLRISDSIGLARSRATVVSPAGATVQAKDILQLTKWVPTERPTLNFFADASNLSKAEIQDALSVVSSAGIKLAADPSADTWTHHLFWDGMHWNLVPHATKTADGQIKPGKPATLGARLSSGELKKTPAGSVVWFDPPLPQESLRALLPPPADGAPPSAAVLTSDRTKATYVIAGTAAGNAPGYAWFKRSDLDADVQTPKGLGAGCSPNSAYPLRTDWVADKPDTALTDSAVQLAKLNGWLHLGSSSLTGQSDFPYQIALQRAKESKDVVDGGSTYKGDYQMALVATSNAPVTPRWVYVLGIDCQGKGSLLWPYAGAPSGRFPTEKGKLDRIVLPGDPFSVDDPFGTDTYLLLTTSSPLTEPSALEFNGVVTRGGGASRSAKQDPLEDLLDSTSAGTRGASRGMPTAWSVQVVQTQSRPEPGSTTQNGKQ